MSNSLLGYGLSTEVKQQATQPLALLLLYFPRSFYLRIYIYIRILTYAGSVMVSNIIGLQCMGIVLKSEHLHLCCLR